MGVKPISMTMDGYGRGGCVSNREANSRLVDKVLDETNGQGSEQRPKCPTIPLPLYVYCTAKRTAEEKTASKCFLLIQPATVRHPPLPSVKATDRACLNGERASKPVSGSAWLIWSPRGRGSIDY